MVWEEMSRMVWEGMSRVRDELSWRERVGCERG